jgi:hypothetical protein
MTSFSSFADQIHPKSALRDSPNIGTSLIMATSTADILEEQIHFSNTVAAFKQYAKFSAGVLGYSPWMVSR